MAGYVKIDRKILKWEWYKNGNVFRVFVHLILTANHNDAKWQGINIKRGQVVIGRIELASSLGLSEQKTRTAIDKLKLTKEITIKSTNKYSIITICKYESYQYFTTQQQPAIQPAVQPGLAVCRRRPGARAGRPHAQRQPRQRHVLHD